MLFRFFGELLARLEAVQTSAPAWLACGAALAVRDGELDGVTRQVELSVVRPERQFFSYIPTHSPTYLQRCALRAHAHDA